MRICLSLLAFLCLAISTAIAGSDHCEKSLQGISSSQIQEARKYVYFLIGAPNAGKGTAGKPLAKTLQLPYVSTGDILRGIIASGSALGQKIAPIIASGQNISTDDLKPILTEWINSQSPSLGFVMDGSPRKLIEALALEEIIQQAGYKGIRAIYFKVSSPTVLERASGRVICSAKSCGQSFHRSFIPPTQEGLCDLCHSPLIRRSDDQSEEIVLNRTRTFETDTIPVIEYFRSKGLLFELNTEQSPNEVLNDLFGIVFQ
jgi:adenylate kinase